MLAGLHFSVSSSEKGLDAILGLVDIVMGATASETLQKKLREKKADNVQPCPAWQAVSFQPRKLILNGTALEPPPLSLQRPTEP